MEKKQYRIEWINTKNGSAGHGSWLDDNFGLMLQIAAHADEQFPEIRHTVSSRDGSTTGASLNAGKWQREMVEGKNHVI